MAPAERLAQVGSQSFVEDDDEYRLPRETFEILDSPHENGVPRRHREPFWKHWLGMTFRSGQKQHLYVDEEEGDGLLRDTHALGTDSEHVGVRKSCRQWCLYGGNAALSIL